PPHVTASWGCHRRLELLLKKGGGPVLREQDGRGAVELALEPILRDSQRAWGWSPAEDPGGARRSLSFLTEDGTDGSVIPELPEDGDGVGPLSSTRRSLLEGLELGGGCGSGEPPSLSIPSLTPWPPGGSSLPPQPLASSTLLSAGAELGEDARGSPGSSPTVLLVPGDHGDPQDTPSDARGSPGSSPTVLLVPGDHGDPQDTPSDARGSPGSSPTVLLVPGDHGDPQDTPSDARGSLHATRSPNPRVLEGGSGWQDPSTLGAHQPRSPHGGFGLLLAPPAGESQGPPPRPTGRSLRCQRGADAAPQRHGMATPGHSPELVAALRTGHVPDCVQDELALARQFDRPDRSRHWREGLLKSSFNYLLLDPRTTQNLPLRSHRLSPAECFRTFVEAIFYVGKGTRARPYCHLAEALSQHHAGTQKGCPKVRRILEIWASGQGVISVHCFQSAVPAEAYTREGCMLEALGLQTITNQRKGNCYGVAASWPAARRRCLGVHMLHRAMRIFLAEGERQLRPPDIQGGR
ncbi:ANKL1 protein, partial [Rynchops niger]|nr:ANKL1 protein [Rynchops niger]